MRTSLTSLLLLILVLSASACTQTTKDYWKTTKGYYYEYLNKSATIDIEDMGIYSTGEGYLAEVMPPVENVLEHFDRALFSLDKAPSDNWMYAFVNRFPWIAGVALVDVDGKVAYKWPSAELEEHDYSFIKQDMTNPEVRHLIGHATESDLGPNIYVATQILDKAQPVGHFVVHFDPRSLFSHVRGSEEFMVVAPGALLWPGMFQVDSTPVAEVNWEELTKNNLSGRISNNNGTFVWYTIMLGTLPLVFTAPDEGSFPEAPGQLQMLATFRDLTIGETVNMAVMTEVEETEAGGATVLASPSVGVMPSTVASEQDIEDLRSQQKPAEEHVLEQPLSAPSEQENISAVPEADLTDKPVQGSAPKSDEDTPGEPEGTGEIVPPSE